MWLTIISHKGALFAFDFQLLIVGIILLIYLVYVFTDLFQKPVSLLVSLSPSRWRRMNYNTAIFRLFDMMTICEDIIYDNSAFAIDITNTFLGHSFRMLTYRL